jgi:hypothetical protein
MNRLLVCFVGLLFCAASAFAQDAAHVQKLLDAATTAFQRNNYFVGVGDVQNACGMLRANPSAMPDANYLVLATMCLEGVKKRIAASLASGDKKGASQQIQSLMPLLQSLMDWDRKNPRWHFEKGNLLREESLAYNNVGFVMQAIPEFKQALAINGGGDYRVQCERQLDVCQKAVAQGWAKARAWDKAHPPRYSPPLPPDWAPTAQFCPLCGHTHKYTESCWR